MEAARGFKEGRRTCCRFAIYCSYSTAKKKKYKSGVRTSPDRISNRKGRIGLSSYRKGSEEITYWERTFLDFRGYFSFRCFGSEIKKARGNFGSETEKERDYLVFICSGNHEDTVAATVSRGRHSENGFVKV